MRRTASLVALFALTIAVRAADLSSAVAVSTLVSQPDAALITTEPFLLRVYLVDSRATVSAEDRLTVTCGGSDWSARLRIEVQTAAGQAQNWQWSWQTCPSGDVVLNPSQGVQTVAVLTPAVTGGIPPGSYFIRVAISSGVRLAESDLSGDSYDDWQAIDVTSDSTRDQMQSISLRRSEYKEFSGDLPGALADADALLQNDADNVAVLARRSSLLSRSGRYEEAVQSMTRSAAAFALKYPDVVVGPEAAAVDGSGFLVPRDANPAALRRRR